MKKESYDNPLVEIIDLPDTDVICESGDVTEHDKGEITFSKNETYFNPSYDISPDATENEQEKHREKTDGEKIVDFAKKLLEQGDKFLPVNTHTDAADASSAAENDGDEGSESPESAET